MTDELHDSGYTEEEINAIFDSLTKGDDLEVPDAFWCGLIIGLWDDDLLPLAGETTRMLSTPRAELDRRIAMVRAAMAGGATLQQAVEMLERTAE